MNFVTDTMPLSAAEKQRRYRERIKQDPEKHAAYLAAERNQTDGQQGKKLDKLNQ